MKKFIILILCLTLGFSAFAQDKESVLEKSSFSLVTLRSFDILGYGFFIESDLVVTNYQVINKARSGAAKAVFGNNKSVDVLGFVAANEEANLVILKIDYNFGVPMDLADTTCEAGDLLYLFNYSEGEKIAIEEGSLNELKDYGYIEMLKITCPYKSQNSGFPVLNKSGEVVGISIPSVINDTSFSYGIAVSKLKELYDSKKSYVEDLKSLSPPMFINTNAPNKSEMVTQFINQGNSRYQAKDYKGAEEKFSSAINLAPGDPDAYLFRGQARIMLLKYKDALSDFNKAIDIEPAFAEAYDLRGIARAELGDKIGACEDWVKSYELGFNEAFMLIKEFCDVED